MTTMKLSEVSPDGGAFRWSPGGPTWQRFGPIIRCAEDTAHTISIPNWAADVWPITAAQLLELIEAEPAA